MTPVNIAAEGACDIRAVERIAQLYGLDIGAKYDCRGKSKLDARLHGFIAASQYGPWIILRDLDTDATCAPSLLASLNTQNHDLTCFRIAVRSIESWLFADKSGLSQWMNVRSAQIPNEPESVQNPKQLLVQIAATSRSRLIKERLCAREADGAMVGAEYGAAIFEFIDQHWDIEKSIEAGTVSSLTKAANRIRELGLNLTTDHQR